MKRRVAIVGVGALGSHVAQFMRNMDADLRVIDMDRIESKNTQSQFHSRQAVGKNKAQALSQFMNFLWCTKLDVVPHRLTKDNARELLCGFSLVIDCLDNGESRRVVQSLVRAEVIPCLHGALAADGRLGRACWDEDFTVDDEPAEAKATCEDGQHLPFIAMTSSYLAQAAMAFLERGSKIGYHITPSGAIRI